MRQNSSNNRRPRNRHHSGGSNGANGGGSNGGGSNGGNPPSSHNPNRVRSAASLRHQTFDSNGPDVRVRGNAWQVHEKYQSLARDAFSSGDRVLAENYQQHAEHYYRVIEAINEATAIEQRGRVQPQAFGGQPEIPQNYYAPDGSLMGQPAPSAPVEAAATDGEQPQPMMAQAEVVRRSPPPSALYSQEEIAEHHGEPLRQPLRMTS